MQSGIRAETFRFDWIFSFVHSARKTLSLGAAAVSDQIDALLSQLGWQTVPYSLPVVHDSEEQLCQIRAFTTRFICFLLPILLFSGPLIS